MKTLYLEQRLSIVRKAINEKSFQFEDLLKSKKIDFHQFVLDLIGVIDGDPMGDCKKRLEALEAVACQDCGSQATDCAFKSDHHGGEKYVCVDRDWCHANGG